jgi:hypothetical protein
MITKKEFEGVREYWERKVFTTQFWGFVCGIIVGLLIALI